MVVAAALALEEGGEAEPPLPLEADAFLRRYEDCFTRPVVTPVAFDVAGLAPVAAATAGDAAPSPSRGSFEAQGGEASAERGELAAGEPGFLLPERGEVAAAAAAAFRASREDTLCGDDGPLSLVAAAGAGDDDGDTAPFTEATGAEEDSGTAREDATAGTGAGVDEAATVTPDPVGFVFSVSAAARKATRDGDDAAALGERVGEPAVFPAAARAEAKVVAGRAERNADGLGSTRIDGDVGAGEGATGSAAAAAGSATTAGAGTAAAAGSAITAGAGSVTSAAAGSVTTAAAGSATTAATTAAGTATAAAAAAVAAAAVAARVPPETAAEEAPLDRPDRASSSVLLISGAFALGLRLGASADRSAFPGMRPPRSVALASALADVSSHEISSAAPVCVGNVMRWHEKDGTAPYSTIRGKGRGNVEQSPATRQQRVTAEGGR